MVKSKKACGKCCCNDCEARLPEALRCCCHCVCDTVCVTLTFPISSDCSCDSEISQEFDYDCNTNSYHGTIICGDLAVDLEFTFKTCKDEDGDDICYICLSSTCLDIDGVCGDLLDCKSFIPGSDFCAPRVNPAISSTCKGVPVDVDDPEYPIASTVWENIDFSGCGDTYCTTGTITVKCVDLITCPAGCGCDETCKGCPCVCRCLCINYTEGDLDDGNLCTDVRKVCWFDDGYGRWAVTFDCPTGPIELILTIVDDGYGNCELLLESDVGTVEDPRKELTCPNVTGTWIITKPYPDPPATVTVACVICDECGIEVCCGPDAPVPRVLTVSFSDFPTYPIDQGCDCLDGTTFELEFDPTTPGTWTTVPRPPARVDFPGCPNGEANFPVDQGVSIVLTCAPETGPNDPLSWSLLFNPCDVVRTIFSTPLIAGEVINCNPLLLVFPLSDMEDCCTVSPEGSEFLTITISE